MIIIMLIIMAMTIMNFTMVMVFDENVDENAIKNDDNGEYDDHEN